MKMIRTLVIGIIFGMALWFFVTNLTACSRRPASGITYFVSPQCHPSATMVGCDKASPPSCKKIALTYDKACEQLVAK